jgi:hypothetical protein
VGRLLFLLPLIACAQIQPNVVDPSGAPIPDVVVTVQRADSTWSVVSIEAPGFREAVHPVPLGRETELERIVLELGPSSEGPLTGRPPRRPRIQVLTVCEALDNRDPLYLTSVVIVGIFKSGLDETLRQDCPNQLVTGDVGWMSAIALTHPADPPESLRAEIEKKRAIVLASGPPGAHPRPERVIALYGRLVSPSGLTSIPCCTAPVEINAAPARLVGLDERDFHVLR